MLGTARPTSGTTLLDLYGGVGVFALAAARRGARAVVVEADPQAIRCGREAAGRMGLPARFEHSDVGAFLARDAIAMAPPDVVIADPPRSGLGDGVARAIARLRPGRVVLVSCDSATAARDARSLAQGGYDLGRVVPVDLFPQTPHVEIVLDFTLAE